MAINYVKLKTAAFHLHTAALDPKMVLFENMSWNFKIRDFHLSLVNKYDVKTLHVSQLNTVVTINGHQLCKNYNCSILFIDFSTSSKNGTFQKYELKL